MDGPVPRWQMPDGHLAIVSTRQVQDGVAYRMSGRPGPDRAATNVEATGVEATLEDSYIWLMNQARAAGYGGGR